MSYGPPALTDRQLKLITDAAAVLVIDRRDIFLQRIGANAVYAREIFRR